jgi:hypothetical protein
VSPEALLEGLRARGIELWAEGATLRYRVASGRLPDDVRSLLLSHKPELLTTLRVANYPTPSAPAQPAAGLTAEEHAALVRLAVGWEMDAEEVATMWRQCREGGEALDGTALSPAEARPSWLAVANCGGSA